MGVALEIIEISHENYSLLSAFIQNLGEEKISFRYFETRGEEVLKNHVFTFLAFQNGTAVGYGHLDREDGIVWLGIVVKKEFQGQGFGAKIMQILISKGKALKIKKIRLSVDNDNQKAISLYKKQGFEIISKQKKNSILQKKLVNSRFETIAISTLAFKGKSREEIVALAKKNDWTIEFSSSFPYQDDMDDFFTNAAIKRLAHNYFPAPAKPFVLNLASTNEAIRQQSINHCISGLELSNKAGAPCFSAHAGFCIDPDPEQLGQRLDVNVKIERKKNWKLFIESVNTILAKAEQLDLSFYIENNVTASFNLRADKEEVLFCSRADEMIRLYDEVNSDSFGLLLDTAHLKVSSQALKFDANNAVEKLVPYIKYVHHSDNNGKRDTNEAIDSNYWFLPWMRKFEKSIHVLEVKNIDKNQIKRQLAFLNDHE
jgi:ribosomal protein S18 acetylase RimI-like enzyme/sugar phosphate isomerase/epimerase